MFKEKLFILILFMGLVSFQFKLSSQTIQTFNTVGAQSWTCPVGVTSVTVECWGAGGGGGGGGAVFNAAGGGGGGGAYASSVITVASGNIYTITVGAGGAGGGSFGTTGGNGSNSSFNSTIVMAAGGNGGIGSGGGATGGIGGAATSCTGTVKYSGGNGGSGTTSGGGGGGSSAGSSINGNNAIQYIGGVAPAGGVAGTSASTLSAGAVGNVGLSGGGGASGGRRGSSATDNAGGAGGAGKVVLSYCTAMSITSTQTNVSCTGGNDGIIDLTVTGGIQNNNNIILDVQTVDDICSTGDIDSWQSFTPTFTARLAAFEVKLDGPDNGNWYLYKGTGVGGVLLASGTYTATAAAGYKYISIPSLPQLTAGQICTFRLTNFSADWLVTCSPNNYSGGQDNNNNADDRVFKTHMVLNPYSYLWSNGALTEDVSNLLAGAYTVTVTDAVGCSAVDTKTITSLGPLAITASASPTTICAGSTSTLTAFGPLTLDQYSITGGLTTFWTSLAEQQTFIPSVSGLLRKVRIQTATFASSANVTISIKSGTPSGGTLLTTLTYFKPPNTNSWDDIILPGSGVNLISGNTYYIELSAGSGVDWIYNSSDVYPNGNAFRGGTSYVYDLNFETYMDLNTYVWNPGSLNNPVIAVNPTITTNHTVTVTNTLSCTNSQMVTVNVAPTSVGGTASANQSICIGQVPSPITLTGFTGAIQWQSSPDNSNWINITGATTNALTSAQMGALSATTYYRANVTSSLCTAALSNTIVITVNPFPNIIASSSSTAICVGFTASLTATGAVNYTWNPTALTGSLVSVSPTTTTVYTVTGTSATGCTNTQTVSLTVNNNPTVTATSSPTAICVGASANLTAAGASTYTWNPGPLTGSLVSVSPTVTTIYTVTGISAGGCVKTETISLIVNSNPTVTATSSPTAICVGTSANLTASGASTYAWSPSSLTGSLVSVSPTVTTIYTVTGTSAGGCVKTQTVNLTVNPNLPLSISISSSSTTICSGTSVNFFSTQANAGSSPTYQWQLNGSNIPGATFATYGTSTLNNNDIVSLIVTSSEVCAVNSPAFSNSITMTVNPNLPLSTSISSSSTTICSGTSVNFLSTEINSGTSPTYQWQLNGSNIAGATFPTFSSNTLNDYDVISLIMTANEFCTTNSPAYSNSITMTVNPNPILSVTASSTTICEGSVSTLSASGANTYTWTPGLISGSIITVTPTINTTYTVTGDNGTGCIGSETISIIVNSLPIANAVLPSSDTICYDGAVAVGLNSQAGITSFSWTSSYGVSNNAQFPTFTNVTSVGNVYFYGSLEDGNGCISLYDTVLVVVTPSITLSALTADVSCFGLTDGLIDLSAAGGFAPYSYSWSNSSFTEDLSSLSAGNYSVTVNDASTCTTSLSVIITEPTSLVANSVESSFIGCNGGNGILTVTATGGTGTYIGTGSYTVVAGNYTYTVTDANGCSSTTTINVNEPTQIVATANITSPIACNGGNALLTVSAIGGTGLYVGAGTFTVAAGNYTYTVTDANGCSTTTTISVTEPTAIVANVNITAPIACNGGNAILTATATGGTGAYTGAGTFTVAAGNYTYTVTDANGCSSNATITVTQPSPVLLIASATNSIICIGQSSNLNATGAQTYTWSPGLLLGASVSVNPVLNTTYTVTGDNGSGCVGSETISIIVNSLPVVNAGANQTICNSQSVTLTGSGSATSYTWNNGAINGTAFTPTISNSYIVTGTDLNNCSNTDTMDVTVNSILTLTLSASTSSICSGATATLTANGASTYTWNPGLLSGSNPSVNPNSTTTYTVVGDNGTGCVGTETISLIVQQLPNIIANTTSTTICVGQSSNLNGTGAQTYTWSPGLLLGAIVTVTPNASTTYTVNGTNGAGCLGTQTISIIVNSLPVVNAGANQTICNSQSVTLTGSGSATSYTWNNGAINGTAFTPTISNSYIVTGTDLNNCSNTDTMDVTVNSILTLTLSASTSSICSGATATLTANGASTYTWNPGLLSGSNPSVNPNSTTTYTVVGDNGTGCVGTETISLIVQQLPNIIANATSTTICVGQSVTLNGAGAANYSWSNGVFDGIAFTPTTTNLYTITGTNAFGCSSTNTIIVNVNNGTSATPNTNPSVICFGDTVQLSVIGGSIPTWSLNSNPSVLTISPMSNISYTYSAIDTLGCVGDITFYVNINQDCDIIVYNGFTPNGDGLNDFWIIDNIEKFPNNKVYIFNRWGNKIFQTTEYNNTNNVWDGKLNGQLVPSGTYFYVIESELLIKKGWIEITN